MKTWNGKRLGLTRIFLIGMAGLVFVCQQARADMTNDIEPQVVFFLTKHRTLFDTPVDTDLLCLAQRAGLSTQQLARVCVKIMNDSHYEAGVSMRAIYSIGRLGLADAFDDLRELSRKGRLEETRQAAMLSALQVAGSRIMPFAREIRDGDGVPEYHRAAMYRELDLLLIEGKARSTSEHRDKAWVDRRAEIVAFLLESAGKQTTPAYILRCDEILCRGVPEYSFSVEREGVLQRAKMQCERVNPQSGKTLKLEEEYVDQELEALRRLPPDKRTSIKWTLGTIGAP